MMKLANEPIELLRTLGERYRHVEQEHQRQPPRGATRHRIETEMTDIHDHFERLLLEWVGEDELRARWRDFLHGRADAPDAPKLPAPPVFKGRTDAGAVLEVRPVADGYDIVLDGARIDHNEVPWHLEPDMRGSVTIAGQTCDETFDAPESAVNELAEFLAGRAAPPWRWARELLDDGLIDPELALTPRGERRLQRVRPTSLPEAQGHATCVIVADGARARVWVLNTDHGAGPELLGVAEVTNPTLRARDVDVVSDSGSGRRGGAKTPIHSPPDHRDQHRRELERQFAAQIAEEAAAVWRRYPACDLIVVAGPQMLGLLRPAIDRQIRAKDKLHVHELTRDLTKLTGPALHDLLAKDKLLPERGRGAPTIPAPGLPT